MPRIFTKETVSEAAGELRRSAMKLVYEGFPTQRIRSIVQRECTAFHRPTKAKITFARDVGHHTHGGYKSPEVNRCYHLSLSFADDEAKAILPFDGAAMTQWLRSLFGSDLPAVWAEPPGNDGRDLQHWHFRLFCDERWNAIEDEPVHMQRELRRRGWVRVGEIVIKEKRVRRPYYPVRLWKTLWIARSRKAD